MNEVIVFVRILCGRGSVLGQNYYGRVDGFYFQDEFRYDVIEKQIYRMKDGFDCFKI